MDIFKFLGMVDDYEARCVAKYEEGDVFVSTAIVNDSPYIETAVAHPFYKEGKVIVVENSETVAEAKVAHKKWIEIMTNDPLPEKLSDDSASPFLQLARSLYDSEEEFLEDYSYPRKEV